MRILNLCVVYKFQTVNPGCSPSQSHTFWSTAIWRDIRAALYFCSCELCWRSAECILVLFCFNVLLDIFAVINCSVFGYRWWFMFIAVTHCSLQQRVKRVRVEWYAQGRPRMEAWRGHLPLCPFKSGAIGSEVPFHHWCSSRQIFGRGEGSFPYISQTCPKSFLCNFAYKISPTNIILTFSWCDLQKRSSCVFCKPCVKNDTSNLLSTF